MKNLVYLLAIGAALAFCGYNVLFSTLFNRTTQGEEVKMIQPNGVILSRDLQASEANVNNGQANALNGQYKESLAVATLTVAQADTTVKSYTANGIIIGGIGGALLGFIAIFGLIIAVFVLFMFLARRSESTSSGRDIIDR